MRIGLYLLLAATVAGCRQQQQQPSTTPAVAATAVDTVATIASAAPSPVAVIPAGDAECLVERSALHGALVLDSPLVARLVASGMDEVSRTYVETVELKTGVLVTYDVGGCQHFRYGFQFAKFPPVRTEDGPALAKLALALLEATPEKTKDEIFHALLRDADAKPPKRLPGEEVETWDLGCQDPTCWLRVRREGGNVVALGLMYDFPM